MGFNLRSDKMYQISGTAAKLVHDKAYHHFTLMLDVNIGQLCFVLSPSLPGIASKATSSTRSQVKTLADAQKGIEYEAVVGAVIDEFCSRYLTTDIVEIDSITNDQFENVEATVQEFSSWHWIYGMTPPFTVSLSLANEAVSVVIHVEKGALTRFTVDTGSHDGRQNPCRSGLEEILNASEYVGCRFEPELCKQVFDWIRRLEL